MIKTNKRRQMLALYKKELASIIGGSLVALTFILLFNLIFVFSSDWVGNIPGDDITFGLAYGLSWLAMFYGCSGRVFTAFQRSGTRTRTIP